MYSTHNLNPQKYLMLIYKEVKTRSPAIYTNKEKVEEMVKRHERAEGKSKGEGRPREIRIDECYHFSFWLFNLIQSINI